jgi:peptide/nickel transport system substrate-binding protein
MGSKKWFLILVAIIGMIFLVSGMSQALEIRDGKKILVYGARQPAPNIDPSQYYDWSTRMLQQSLYDALLKYVGSPPQVIPWLATKWEVSPDAKVWTFNLVKNAKFHNGDPVTAEAVKFSFERTLKIKPGSRWSMIIPSSSR